MKSALLAVAWNADDWTFEALESHYNTLVRYLNLQGMGRVLGYGCGTVAMTEKYISGTGISIRKNIMNDWRKRK